MKYTFISFLLAIFLLCGFTSRDEILIEAESFEETGGWLNDNRSPGMVYLIAHGLGTPVADARTTFLAEGGKYRLWVKTRDWTKSWNRNEAPGRFNIVLNGVTLGVDFGTVSSKWEWQDGGVVTLKEGINLLSLHDLTGFDGRCDAVYFSSNLSQKIPSPSRNTLDKEFAGKYDLIVVGGGMAGCCTALSAARLGCKVALIQDRPVLGGNNSSEIRVGLSGRTFQNPYPNLGLLLDEFDIIGFWNNVEANEDPASERSQYIKSVLSTNPEKLIHNAGPASNYGDDKKLSLIKSEKNIDLFLNMQAIETTVSKGHIKTLTARDIKAGKELVFESKFFADCTGDGTLGYISGADYRIGRESKEMTGEPHAPETPDSLVMGMSVQWNSEEGDENVSFPDCPWAMQMNDSTCIVATNGEWNWEAGCGRDMINDVEYIRDLALRAIYGNWSWLKNCPSHKDAFAKKRLSWVSHIGGKRESRRLLGDIILSEQDLVEGKLYNDASFTATWPIDLHYPVATPGLDEEPFLARSQSIGIKPYAVPYRCLYSRNIDNLFMAGRDISVTHIALGTVRVMRTCAMMGEVVGMAASICNKNNCLPRDVYKYHLDNLILLMKKGVGK